ncbi:MAG: DUF2334 domain-containing protein [Victivallales bacterium]|nr:DUF2334 domain-containing protein [Victivallales bacterium]
MTNPFYFCMTVDDVALRDWSTPEHLERLLDFFRGENLRATLFVVPIDEGTDQPFWQADQRYLPLLREAHQDGFRFGQHGLRHNRFELGIPPDFVLNLPHEAENKRWAQENRELLERDHTVENCRARLRQGRRILEDAFVFPVQSFRAPALQESPAMFQALKQEGYLVDSSALLQETAYDYYLDRMDAAPIEITRELWEAKRRNGFGLTLPLTCDYTWDLHDSHYAQVMSMAQHDFRQCLENDLPFVTVCHVNPVLDGEGIRFLREFLQFARSSTATAGRELQFKTLEDLAPLYA